MSLMCVDSQGLEEHLSAGRVYQVQLLAAGAVLVQGDDGVVLICARSRSRFKRAAHG